QRCCARRVVVCNFLGTKRIANIEYANAGVEVAARERSGMMLVIDAAVMTPIREDREADEIGLNRGAIRGVVDLEGQSRHDLGICLVANVDDSRHRKRREPGRARRCLLSSAGTAT